ncbi:hypothetical protein DFH27DRAFT_53440 [Peziza echinospora]|nr:hypothetical protein DFH27DRAFT_53440 [Peziza echinospora]
MFTDSSNTSIYHHVYHHDKDMKPPLSLHTTSDIPTSFSSNGMYTPPTVRSPIAFGNGNAGSSGLASSASSIYGSVYNDSTVSLVPYMGSGYTSLSSSYMSTSSGRSYTPSPPPTSSGSNGGHGGYESNAGTIRGGKFLSESSEYNGKQQSAPGHHSSNSKSSNSIWPSPPDREGGQGKGEGYNQWKSIDKKAAELSGSEGKGAQATTSLTPPPPFRPAMTALPSDPMGRPDTANSYFSVHHTQSSGGANGEMGQAQIGDPVKETDYWPPAESQSMQPSQSSMTVINVNAAVSASQQHQQQQLLAEYAGSTGGGSDKTQQMMVVDPGLYHGFMEFQQQQQIAAQLPPVVIQQDASDKLEGLKKLVIENAEYLQHPDRPMSEEEGFELRIVTFQRPCSRKRSAAREYRAGVVKSPKIVTHPHTILAAQDPVDFIVQIVDCMLIYLYLVSTSIQLDRDTSTNQPPSFWDSSRQGKASSRRRKGYTQGRSRSLYRGLLRWAIGRMGGARQCRRCWTWWRKWSGKSSCGITLGFHDLHLLHISGAVFVSFWS